jgi:O-palmitoleoyl transferase
LNSLTSGLVIVYYYGWSIFQSIIILIILVHVTLISLNRQDNKYKNYKGYIILVVSACHQLLNSIVLLNDKSDQVSMRVIEMILIMKSVSLAFDLDSSSIQYCYNIFDLSSYLLSINTSLLGPWISYNQHEEFLNKKSFKLSIVKEYFRFLMLSIVALFVSNCLTMWIIGNLEESGLYSPIIGTFIDALSFRFGHYFICYFCQSIYALNQINFKYNKLSIESNHQIVNASFIEWPRSMINVVTNWNLPMHFWLKEYIFKEVKQRYGLNGALFLTYLISSMVHNFDFRIIVILFSLGLYSKVEFVVRQKLSFHLNSCCLAKRCKSSHKCDKHKLKEVTKF